MQEKEKQSQIETLNYGEHSKWLQELRREQFYRGLKERAKQVDYGSHKVI